MLHTSSDGLPLWSLLHACKNLARMGTVVCNAARWEWLVDLNISMEPDTMSEMVSMICCSPRIWNIPQAGLFLASSAKNSLYSEGDLAFPVSEHSLVKKDERLGKSLLVRWHNSLNSDLESSLWGLRHLRSFVYPEYLSKSDHAFIDDTRILSGCRLPTIGEVDVIGLEISGRKSFRKPVIVPLHTMVCGVGPQTGHWQDSLQSISISLANAFHALRRWLIEAGLVKLRTSCFRWQARRYEINGFFPSNIRWRYEKRKP